MLPQLRMYRFGSICGPFLAEPECFGTFAQPRRRGCARLHFPIGLEMRIGDAEEALAIRRDARMRIVYAFTRT